MTANPRRHTRLFHLAVLAGSLLGLSACGIAPHVEKTRIVGGLSRWDAGGYYRVFLVVENGSGTPLDLQDVFFEMTTFDGQGQVLDESYPFAMKGAIDPHDNDRILLTRNDPEGKIARSQVIMKDARGRTISRWKIAQASEPVRDTTGPLSGAPSFYLDP